ncbi:Solitary outer membrane autotransporter beta-barrel domain [Vibrio sinaloensis]|nr:Solitary outer membrane autotransporter beta-barrel domain [Vibrio sinaloensis]
MGAVGTFRPLSTIFFTAWAGEKANGGDVGNPEGWYMGNGLEAYYNVNHWGKSLQSLYTSIRRIDIGGDTSDPLGTEHYYEGSVGWLMTPPFKSNLIDNIGIGLNINYGSALKGGSIVFFSSIKRIKLNRLGFCPET